MAVPTIQTDLSDITLAESVTNWLALGGGASGLSAGADFSMQGTNCVDKQITAAEKGQVFNNGATITLGAADHIFVWAFLATPGLANTLALRGLGIVIGTATTAYNTFHVEGSDTYGAAGRVGKCYPIRYVTSSNGSVPYRTLTGSPGANPQYFGATANITGTVKGPNLGVDAMRYGTGIYVTAGDGTTPATITGIAATNDTSTNRWGILTAVGGGYELQGKLVIGQNNTQAATAAYFDDSSAPSIVILDTPHSLTDFTQIIIDHASTTFNLSGATIRAIGTNNPGQFTYNNASTISTLTGCTFVDIGISTLRAGVTANSSKWIGCGLITSNGAVMNGCEISSSASTPALIINSVAESNAIDNCVFTGNTRAIKITAAGDYNFDGHTFSGNTYDVENASTGAVTINNLNQSNASTAINTAGGTTTFITAVPVTIKCVDENNNNLEGIVVYVENASTKAQILSTTTNASGIATVSFNYPGSDVSINIRLRKASTGATKYIPIKTPGTITNTGFSLTATLYVDSVAAP